jgi:hypothetical protein
VTAPSEQKTARSPIGEFGDLILRNRVGCVAGWRWPDRCRLTGQTPRDWIEYNTIWPHSALGCLTPTDYAEAWAAGHRTHNERINKGSGQRGVALHCCLRDLVLRLNSDLRQGVA